MQNIAEAKKKSSSLVIRSRKEKNMRGLVSSANGGAKHWVKKIEKKANYLEGHTFYN